MALTAGIVDLPNVGKSTLLMLLQKLVRRSANYPFATIDLTWEWLKCQISRLSRIEPFNSYKNWYHTTFEFTDIAGII